jgi:hypothetical protein
VRDEKAPAAQRVIAVVALYRAGEPTPIEVLIPMLRATHQTDLQQAIVWLLGQSQDPAAVETVVGCLSHPNAALHETAACAAYYQKPPAAIDALAERIREQHAAGKEAYWFTLALGEIDDPRTPRVLAQLLAETLKTAGPDAVILRHLVYAFDQATGSSFHDEGKTNQDRARNALAWWREEGQTASQH